MNTSLTSPLNFVPTMPDYRVFRLKCRFTIGAAPCHQRIGPMLPLCFHMEKAASEAGSRFVEDMVKQGWELTDGRIELTNGPFPSPLVDSAPLPTAVKIKRERGPHARFGPAYASPVVERPTLENTDAWDYEISGLFVRKLMPTVLAQSTLDSLKAKRKAHRVR